MSMRGEVALTDVIGERGAGVKVEESWSKDVPAGGAEGGGAVEFNRSEAIMAAVERKRNGTWLRTEEEAGGVQTQRETARSVSQLQYFFVFKGGKMDYIGKKEVDLGKFRRDLSGRFFREWLKKEFPERRDYDDVVTFVGGGTVGEMVELMEMAR